MLRFQVFGCSVLIGPATICGLSRYLWFLLSLCWVDTCRLNKQSKNYGVELVQLKAAATADHDDDDGHDPDENYIFHADDDDDANDDDDDDDNSDDADDDDDDDDNDNHIYVFDVDDEEDDSWCSLQCSRITYAGWKV